MGRRARAGRADGRSAPLWLVAVGLLLATAAGVLVSFRVGGLLIAALLAVIAAARTFLPVAALGPLAVRSRVVDVLVCLVLATLLGSLAVVAPGGGPEPTATSLG